MKKKKYGKVGSPHSAKRKKWMRRMREAQRGRVLTRKVGGSKRRRKRK